MKSNDCNDLFICLFVCPELIEELTGATDLKFGMRWNILLLVTSSKI